MPSKIVLTIPSGSPSAIALPLPINGKWPTLTSYPASLAACFGEADAGDLRAAIGAGRDVAGVERVHVVDPGDPLDADHALVAGLVRQPWRPDEIADRIDAGLAGAQPFIDDDMGALDHDAGALEPDVLDIADDADGEDDALDARLERLAAGLDPRRDRVARRAPTP